MEQQTSPKKSGARKREAYKMPNKCPVCGKRFKYLFCMNEHLKKSKICASQVVQPDVEEETTTQLDLTQENGQIVVIQQERHKCARCVLMRFLQTVFCFSFSTLFEKVMTSKSRNLFQNDYRISSYSFS